MLLSFLKLMFIPAGLLFIMRYSISIFRGRFDVLRGLGLLFCVFFIVNSFHTINDLDGMKFYYFGLILILLISEIATPIRSKIYFGLAPLGIHFAGILNISIMLTEMIGSQIDEDFSRAVQLFFIDKDTLGALMLHRPIFGISILRPIGLFGQLHMSGMFAAMYTLYILSLARTSFLIKVLVLAIGLVFLSASGTTQSTLSLAVGGLLTLMLTSSRRQKIPLLCLSVFGGLFLTALLGSVGHLSTTRPDSMLRLYRDGIHVITSDAFTQCLSTGCLWPASNFIVWYKNIFAAEIQTGLLSPLLVDNGFLYLIELYGVYYLIGIFLIFLIGLFQLLSLGENGTRPSAYTVRMASIYCAGLITFLHYPTMLTAIGLSIIVLFSLDYRNSAGKPLRVCGKDKI